MFNWLFVKLKYQDTGCLSALEDKTADAKNPLKESAQKETKFNIVTATEDTSRGMMAGKVL